jgi:hypothetical protein
MSAAPAPPAATNVPLTWNLSNSTAAEAQHLLPGERIVHSDANVFFAYDATDDATRVAGALICTNFQLLFVESATPHVRFVFFFVVLPVFFFFFFFFFLSPSFFFLSLSLSLVHCCCDSSWNCSLHQQTRWSKAIRRCKSNSSRQTPTTHTQQ